MANAKNDGGLMIRLLNGLKWVNIFVSCLMVDYMCGYMIPGFSIAARVIAGAFLGCNGGAVIRFTWPAAIAGGVCGAAIGASLGSGFMLPLTFWSAIPVLFACAAFPGFAVLCDRCIYRIKGKRSIA
jgi:hypothetical protein